MRASPAAASARSAASSPAIAAATSPRRAALAARHRANASAALSPFDAPGVPFAAAVTFATAGAPVPAPITFATISAVLITRAPPFAAVVPCAIWLSLCFAFGSPALPFIIHPSQNRTFFILIITRRPMRSRAAPRTTAPQRV